ncbi:MAG: NADP-dependent oxidoreductase, partial [Rhizorhabdus sp.]
MARAWSLKARPQGMPQHTDFAMIDLDQSSLGAGEVRIANRWLSVDPYMRGRMNDVKSYVPPFALGEAMQGGAVGEVIESNDDGIKVGDMVLHMAGWRDEAVVPAAQVQKLPALDVPAQAFLGQLGMPGMTG